MHITYSSVSVHSVIEMRKIVFVFITLFLISCSSNEKDRVNHNLKEFNEHLGPSKSKVLTEAVNSLDKFLTTNYPNLKEENERTSAFLEHLLIFYNTDSLNNIWKFNTKENKDLLTDFETSGMRIEIEFYGYEDFEYNNQIDSLYPEENNYNEEESEILFTELEEMFKEDSIANIGRDTTGYAEYRRESEEYDKKMQGQRDSLLSYNIYGQFLYSLAKHTKNDTNIQNYVDARRTAGDISPSLLINAYLDGSFDYKNPFFKRMLVTDFYLDIIRWDIKRK